MSCHVRNGVALGVVALALVGVLSGCATSSRGSTASTSQQGTVFASIYDGSAWVPSTLARATGSPSGSGSSLGQFDFVSCPEVGTCFAAGSVVRRADGRPLSDLVSRLSQGQWSAPLSLPSPPEGIRGLSCSGASSCVAVGSDSTFVFDGSAWKRGPEFPGNASRLVSCSHPSFCLEIEPTTFSYESERGGVWTAPLRFAPLRGTNVLPDMLSCPEQTFCLGLSDLDAFWLFDGTGWSISHRIPLAAWQGFDPKALSCSGPDFCVAVGADLVGDDEAATFNGAAWTPPAVVAHPGGYSELTSVACPQDDFCVATGTASQPAEGFATVYRDSKWSPPMTLPGANDQPAVACATSRYCVALTGATLSFSKPG